MATRILVWILCAAALAFVMGRTTKGCCKPDKETLCQTCNRGNVNA